MLIFDLCSYDFWTAFQLGGYGANCSLQLDVPTTMKAPILVYYAISNFHQNHRRYVDCMFAEEDPPESP